MIVTFLIVTMAMITMAPLAPASGAPAKPTLGGLLSSMTLEQKVGQLFLIQPEQLDSTLPPAPNKKTKKDKKAKVQAAARPSHTQLTPAMKETLRRYPPGGFILFSKNIVTPEQLKRFTGELRQACPIPPFIAVDEEGGRIARIARTQGFGVPTFKSARTIGKTGAPQQAREMGSAIGAYLAEYGFNLNFAPVADVDSNPENTVIGNRAFGSDPKLVSAMVGSYLEGLHGQGVMGCLKHFPGHGDTKGDTHTGAVTLNKTWEELQRTELIPFVGNLDRADSVMVAHITLRKVTRDGRPATLSRDLVTGKLRGELGYDGLVITDAMSMGAIQKHYSPANAAVLAIEAGNDVVLTPWDYRKAFEGVLQAVRKGRLTEERLNESVRRILRAKGFDDF